MGKEEIKKYIWKIKRISMIDVCERFPGNSIHHNLSLIGKLLQENKIRFVGTK